MPGKRRPFNDGNAVYNFPPLAGSGPDTTTIYFAPQDSNGTATVLMLSTTTAVTQTATIQGYNSDGNLTVFETILIPGHDRFFAGSDRVTGPPPSWANFVFANFTDFTA